MKKIFSFTLIGTYLLPLFIFSQDEFADAVKYKLKLDRETLRGGEVISLTADLKIKKEYHIYASNPDMSLSPSYFEWEDSSSFSRVGIMIEPEPKSKYDPMFEMEVGFHKGSVQLRQDLQLTENLKPGNYSLNGTFIYR